MSVAVGFRKVYLIRDRDVLADGVIDRLAYEDLRHLSKRLRLRVSSRSQEALARQAVSAREDGLVQVRHRGAGPDDSFDGELEGDAESLIKGA
jgi:hypothetical protein